MNVPDLVRPRLVAQDEDGARLSIEDDRAARAVVLGMGTLSVASLSAGWLVGGPVWPWVGLVSVPALCAIALAVTLLVGRRACDLHLCVAGVRVDGVWIAWVDVQEVVFSPQRFTVRSRDAQEVVRWSGEDDGVQAALQEWIAQLRVGSAAPPAEARRML